MVTNVSNLFKHCREGHGHPPSYAYGDAHKCKKRCDCTACCCDSKKDILCQLLQIFLMLFIIQLVITAILTALANPFGRRRKRRRRSLEGLSSYLQVLQNSKELKHGLSVFYRVILVFIDNFLVSDSHILGEIGSNSIQYTNEISQVEDSNREPRIFFGYDENDPPKPDLCKKKCCKKCCKKDKILCIIQVILLIIAIILLMILIVILAIPFIGRRKRRRRSAPNQQCLPIYSLDNDTESNSFSFKAKTNSTCKKESDDISDIRFIQEVADSIKEALSSIVRTRDFSVALRQEPSKCKTCVEWSVYDLGLEYGPFLVHSKIPEILKPLIL